MVMFLRGRSGQFEALCVRATARSLEIELVERDGAERARPLAQEEEKGVRSRGKDVEAALGREALAHIENHVLKRVGERYGVVRALDAARADALVRYDANEGARVQWRSLTKGGDIDGDVFGD